MACVNLRPIKLTDAERCLRWVSHPEVLRYLGLVQPARSLLQERTWIAGILADKQHQRMFIIEDEEGLAVGTCGLREIDKTKGSALLGLMIGDPNQWGRGLGAAATSALVTYGFETFDLKEIRLICHQENGRALRCYEKVGFQELPAPKGVNPRPNDIWMTLTRERWQELQTDQGAEA
jgi:RimJ/RimL family protein N-acetyltransferase